MLFMHQAAPRSTKHARLFDRLPGDAHGGLRPGPSWREQLSGQAGAALITALFTTAGRTRNVAPTLGTSAREALLGFATLSGEVFSAPADRTAFQLHFFQQVR